MWNSLTRRTINGGTIYVTLLPAPLVSVLDLFRRVASHRVPTIPVPLKSEPEFGGHTKDSLQAERGVRGDRAFATDDLVQSGEGDPEPAERERFESVSTDDSRCSDGIHSVADHVAPLNLHEVDPF